MNRIPPFEPPDRDTFVHPWNDRQLLAYYDDLRRWHGYIRFLGMPHRKDEPDVPISDLYVEPCVSRTWMTPDNMNDKDAAASVEALGEHPRLVLLGDPGSGKSTLVSWVAWRLSRSQPGRLREVLGDLVPVPMVLREMKIERGMTWEKLWEAFLELSVAEKLREHEGRDAFLERGQAVILLDGLDEVSSVEVRQDLRATVFEGMRRFPRCRFVLTSRLVGYDEVEFHGYRLKSPVLPDGNIRLKEVTALRYVAPFNDDQIERFTANWYVSREKAQVRAEGGAEDLVEAVRRSEHTLRLARIPNLLTFMALIHRVRAKLPDGRALLYDEIAEAYLETIDTFRGLQEMDFPLHQKTRWLGFVAYRMQLRRIEGGDDGKDKREILVEQAMVEEWLAEEMRRDQIEEPEATATAFLDYLGRRSGLLLPRGQGVFAFAHLSFQEFFAATYLLRLVMAPRRVQKEIAPTFDEDLKGYGKSVAWSETLVLLFELLARYPDFVDDVLDGVFGEGLQFVVGDKECEEESRAVVLAQAAIDPHSALRTTDRSKAIRVGWEWERRWQSQSLKALTPSSSGVPRALLRADLHLRAQVLGIFCEVFEAVKKLFLEGCPNVEKTDVLTAVRSLHGLTRLNLISTHVEDFTPLANLQNLSDLDLSETRVKDLSPLANLKKLITLVLSETRVEDLSPLANLKNLKSLALSETRVEDLSPLANLKKLSYLDLSETRVKDLSPLANLQNLSILYLAGTRVEDLSPLANLKKLSILLLTGAHVKDLSPLDGIEGLKIYR
jgi:internalin A